MDVVQATKTQKTPAMSQESQSFAFRQKKDFGCPTQVLVVASCPITTVNFTITGTDDPVEVYFDPWMFQKEGSKNKIKRTINKTYKTD